MQAKDNGHIKVAIASHGLGFVKRGTEMWAKNIGYALKEKDMDVFLYKGWGKADSRIEKTISCIKRDSPLTNRIIKYLPSWRWRFGCNNAHALEATSFAWNLAKELNKNRIDIVHTADPQVARTLVTMRRYGLIKARIIYADAIPDEPLDFITKYGFVQHRTPYYLDKAKKVGIDISNRYAIPNFVDTAIFKPGIKTAIRKEQNIPDDAFVVLSVATVDKAYKRIDYLIKEFGRFRSSRENNAYLIICGARRGETEELVRIGASILGNNVRYMLDQPYEKLPEIYAASDVFTLCSVNEVFGIAFIEAMACGKPVIGHVYPPTQWIIGSGGDCVDMLKEGALSDVLVKYLDNGYRIKKGQYAREEAVRRFSKDIVIDEISSMYKEVLKCSH